MFDQGLVGDHLHQLHHAAILMRQDVAMQRSTDHKYWAVGG